MCLRAPSGSKGGECCEGLMAADGKPLICVPGTVCNAVRKRCHDVCTGYSVQCDQRSSGST
jgi:hypothetical protein